MLVMVALAVVAPLLWAGDAGRFDDLVHALERYDPPITTPESAAPVIRDLQDALPPGDLDRQARLDGVLCEWGFPALRDRQRAFAEGRLAYYRESEHPEGMARVLRCRGALEREAGNFAAGLADFDEAISIAAPLGEPVLLANLLRARGDAHSFQGDFVLALEDLLSAHALLEGEGESDLAARLFFDLGAVYRRLGAYGEADQYLAREIAAAEASGDALRATMAHIQLGFSAFDQGDGAGAERSFRTAAALAREAGNEVIIANVHVALASALNMQGAHRQALQEIESAQALYDKTGYALNSVMAGLQRGVAYAGLGRHAQAITAFEMIEPVLVERDQTRLLAILYLARANSLEAAGRPERAVSDWRRHHEVREALELRSQRDRADLLRVQFEVSRREMENQRLLAETALQQERYAAMARTRTWQTLSLALAIVLGLALTLALLGQVLRARRLQVMAMTDELTGVANRRRTELYLAEQMRLCRRLNRPLSVVSMDIDQFKVVNDTWGHPAGDAVLQRVCRTLAANLLRLNDVIGRIGGEEFLLVLPDTPLDAARAVAERLRAAVASTDMSDIIGQSHVTISLGVATARPGDSVATLEARVDDALYRAKQSGRGRVEVSTG